MASQRYFLEVSHDEVMVTDAVRRHANGHPHWSAR